MILTDKQVKNIHAVDSMRKMNVNWPRITVVTPSFNQGNFIEETILSVINQGYPNLEYIVIDGGSTDNTVEILKKYDHFLSYWISEQDQGQADALNKGFDKASGEICAYLNSDDLFLPGAFYHVAMSYMSYRWAWLQSNTLVGECIDSSYLWPVATNCNLPLFICQQAFAQQGVFWKADASPKPYFDAKWQYIMDHAFFNRLYLKHNNPFLLNANTSFFRIHPNAKTSKYESVRLEEERQQREEIKALVHKNVSSHIDKEWKRMENRRSINKILETKELSLAHILRAISLAVSSPYPFRDRTFISAIARISSKVFFK